MYPRDRDSPLKYIQDSDLSHNTSTLSKSLEPLASHSLSFRTVICTYFEGLFEKEKQGLEGWLRG